jgi:4-amino-4-deoxy-L-arabinose transferase-like glycosyltransferase
MKKIIVLVVSIVIAFIFLSYKLTQVPPGINGDESGIGYNAILISRNLTDENNNFLPLFIFAKGSDWKQPVSVYTTALVFRVLGVSFWALRATSILFVIISIVILYFLAKEKFDDKFFIIAFVILITTPIILIQSHLALENIAVLPFIFFWLLMLAKNEKNKKNIYTFLGGVSLGVGIFSYLGMRIVVPVLSVLTLIYIRKNLKQVLYFLLGVLPFFVLLYVANLYYPGAVTGHFSASLPTVNEFLLRYISVFDLSFLFLKGDATAIHSTGKVGMFLIATLPILLIGIWRILKRRKPFEILILSSFFLTPLMFGFVPDIYRASRLLELVPFFVIISAIGFTGLSRKIQILILALVVINSFIFVKDYWFDYSDRVKDVFPVSIENTYEFRLKK